MQVVGILAITPMDGVSIAGDGTFELGDRDSVAPRNDPGYLMLEQPQDGQLVAIPQEITLYSGEDGGTDDGMMNEGCPVFLEGALTGDSTTQFVFDNLGYGLGFPTAVLADTSGFSGPLLSDYVNVDDDSSNTTTYSPDHPPPSSVDASSLSGIVIVDGDVGLNVVDGAAALDVLVLENGATVNASAIDAVMVEMNGDNDTLSANIGPDTMLSVTGTNDDLNGDTDAASQLAIDPDATLYASGDLAGAVLGAGSLYNNGNLTVSGGVGSFTGTYNVVGSSGNFTIEAVSGANLWMGTDNSGADQINAATFVLDSSNPTAGIIQVDDGVLFNSTRAGQLARSLISPGLAQRPLTRRGTA